MSRSHFANLTYRIVLPMVVTLSQVNSIIIKKIAWWIVKSE